MRKQKRSDKGETASTCVTADEGSEQRAGEILERRAKAEDERGLGASGRRGLGTAGGGTI
ncbi:hypothetical protein [Raoultibacter massiliensis]|uniref:hypothetical protein n=1 Tax=Raoultibacter massiliensis TaxID=1852371 RepID=UPI003A8EB1A2